MRWRLPKTLTIGLLMPIGICPIAAAQTVPEPPVSVADLGATASLGPKAVEPEAISLARIVGLAHAALADIASGMQDYGQLQGFAGDYDDAMRGLLDTLLGEWAMGGRIASVVADGRTDRLVSIRDALVTADQDNEDFVRDTRESSLELAAATDAISYRQQQIVLYGRLRGGLNRDRDLYRRILAVASGH